MSIPSRFLTPHNQVSSYFVHSLGKLPTYHAGDVIVSLDAQVSGGIGPQHSGSSMVIKTQGG